MDKTDNLSIYLTDIANALRTVDGSSDLIPAQSMAERILALRGGGEQDPTIYAVFPDFVTASNGHFTGYIKSSVSSAGYIWITSGENNYWEYREIKGTNTDLWILPWNKLSPNLSSGPFLLPMIGFQVNKTTTLTYKEYSWRLTSASRAFIIILGITGYLIGTGISMQDS